MIFGSCLFTPLLCLSTIHFLVILWLCFLFRFFSIWKPRSWKGCPFEFWVRDIPPLRNQKIRMNLTKFFGDAFKLWCVYFWTLKKGEVKKERWMKIIWIFVAILIVERTVSHFLVEKMNSLISWILFCEKCESIKGQIRYEEVVRGGEGSFTISEGRERVWEHAILRSNLPPLLGRSNGMEIQIFEWMNAKYLNFSKRLR